VQSIMIRLTNIIISQEDNATSYRLSIRIAIPDLSGSHTFDSSLIAGEVDSAKTTRGAFFGNASGYQRMATIAKKSDSALMQTLLTGRSAAAAASSCISVKNSFFPSLFVVASLYLSTFVFARRIPLSLALHRRNQRAAMANRCAL